ncbi:MAG: AtpZ/AtpI family protein [Acidobacteria bacterium]|nr:AtpZ/AtpI family protein [Acidobacteriota bacterium]MCA1641289.1 AtpZ/AtpI family protein [Acidobacteriota bacterium]
MSKKNDQEDEGEVNRRSGVMYAAALSIFFSVLVGFGIGWALDKWLGTTPWMVVAGIVAGSALGFYEFIRLTSKLD